MSNDHIPLVSVAVPAYNVARYIESALESVLRQSFRDFELIVINDGSTDTTPRLLDRIASTDCRVKVVHQQNQGLAPALNRALAECRGKYIARMDGDDLCVRERFEKQVEYLESNPDCVLLGTHIQFIDCYDAPLVEVPALLRTHEEIDAGLMKGRGGSLCHPTVMMRADAVRKVGGYNNAYSNNEDLDIFLKLCETGRAYNLGEVLLKYRRHLQSVNFTKHEIQRRNREFILKDAAARRGVPVPGEQQVSNWRPPPRDKQLRAWGWSALTQGYTSAARRHAVDALRAGPLSVESWKLMACAIRGR
jgi:glycosyltransferase involved in cell wall biosynthesis